MAYEQTSLYCACNDRNAFFTSDAVRNYNLWSCQKVYEAPTFLLEIFILDLALIIQYDRKLLRIAFFVTCLSQLV